MLDVGAKPSGQASCDTATHKWISPSFAKVEAGFPVIEISFAPMRFITGTIAKTSPVSPECEMVRTTSSLVIIPKSPWLASPGCTKNEGVPVLANVAAIFPPIWPDLPMPTIITLPLQLNIN